MTFVETSTNGAALRKQLSEAHSDKEELRKQLKEARDDKEKLLLILAQLTIALYVNGEHAAFTGVGEFGGLLPKLRTLPTVNDSGQPTGRVVSRAEEYLPEYCDVLNQALAKGELDSVFSVPDITKAYQQQKEKAKEDCARWAGKAVAVLADVALLAYNTYKQEVLPEELCRHVKTALRQSRDAITRDSLTTAPEQAKFSAHELLFAHLLGQFKP